MKYTTIFLFIFISIISVRGQEVDTTIHILKSLDWGLMSCGKSPIWIESKETLLIVNKTDKSIQGYWISNTNLIQKQGNAFVNAHQSNKLNVRAGEYWIICDLDNNALGVFQILQGENKIFITETDFKETRKLPTNLIDNSVAGTISG